MQPWHQDEQTKLYHGDSLDVLRALPSDSVQCVVTSPPYWALRDYGVDGQMGLESTPEQYVDRMVELFREVRRVLRPDGTLWLNIGDSYAAGGKLGGPRQGNNSTLDGTRNYQDQGRGSTLPAGLHESHRQAGVVGRAWCPPPEGLKCKDLVGIPWMLAFALRADGWYLRQEIIWAKKSPMPESVKDRCTKSHEQIFLLTKQPRYFYDAIGSQEQAVAGNPRNSRFDAGKTLGHHRRVGKSVREDSNGRNMRSVWPLSSYPLKSAHFAAYPPELVRRCLTAGVSERGCCVECGNPWTRITEKQRVPTRPGTGSKVNRASQHEDSPYEVHSGEVVGNRDPQRHVTHVITTVYRPSCECQPASNQPCTVLDPFHGAGTTWKVCQRLGLNYIGIELNEEYLRLSVERPAVHFPHESKKRRATNSRKKKTLQLELEF